MKKKSSEALNSKYIGRFILALKIFSVIMAACMLVILVMTAMDLPAYGTPESPSDNEVPERYIEKGTQETGAVNYVAGMILDYRAFDTFGESNVLFAATICVTVMLRIDSRKRKKKRDKEEPEIKSDAVTPDEAPDRDFEPENDMIVQKGAVLVFPIIMVFGLYVVLNGHLSPGGGFSGGAVLGAGLILFVNAFGFDKISGFMNAKSIKIITLCSLLVYCLAKSYSFFTGANGLESGIPLGTPGAILSSGLILLLNICVGFVVACTMYSFYTLVRRGRI